MCEIRFLLVLRTGLTFQSLFLCWNVSFKPSIWCKEWLVDVITLEPHWILYSFSSFQTQHPPKLLAMELLGGRSIVYWQKVLMFTDLISIVSTEWLMFNCGKHANIDLRPFSSWETAILFQTAAIPCANLTSIVYGAFVCFQWCHNNLIFVSIWSSISALCVSKWQYWGKSWLPARKLHFFWNPWFLGYQKYLFYRPNSKREWNIDVYMSLSWLGFMGSCASKCQGVSRNMDSEY